jgi:hypothetical protein
MPLTPISLSLHWFENVLASSSRFHSGKPGWRVPYWAKLIAAAIAPHSAQKIQ